MLLRAVLAVDEYPASRFLATLSAFEERRPIPAYLLPLARLSYVAGTPLGYGHSFLHGIVDLPLHFSCFSSRRGQLT